MAIFGPTFTLGAVVLSFRPTRRETVKSLMQIRASPLPPRTCLTGQKNNRLANGGRGGGYLAERQFFLFLSYQLSRVKEKYNETLTTLTSILSPPFNLKKSEVEELGTRKKGRKLLSLLLVSNDIKHHGNF